MALQKRLTVSFYQRPAIEVARDCLGKVLVHGPVAGKIVEVEAYLGPTDLAAHASRGITPRTQLLFGPPGYAYVYLIYGMYYCLNFVAEPEHSAGCVLIRALEPLAGIEQMFVRRPAAKRVRDLASGPGRLALAMGIDGALNGSSLMDGPLEVRTPDDPEPFEIRTTPRIGITRDADRPLRFLIAGNHFVSQPRFGLTGKLCPNQTEPRP